LLAFGILYGCGNSDVSLVKKGTMNGYETTTIGKAFETSFDNPKWEGFKGQKGERVVQFTGKISKNLHHYVTDEVKQELNDMQEYDEVFFDAKLILLQSAVERLGGDKSKIIQDINNKYDCELTLNDNSFWNPKCKDKETAFKYVGEVINASLNELWKEGEPVVVQWIITPDGKSFSLNHMGCAAWQGFTFENILDAIYK